MSDRFAQLFTDAGCTGQLCVQTSDGDGEIAVGADSRVIAASVIKVLVALEAERQFAAGELDPHERVNLSAGERAPGGVGFSLYRDDVQTSLRDLVIPTLTISDNVASDALLDRVGIRACNDTARSLGLAHTVVVSGLGTMIEELVASAGFADWPAYSTWLSHATREQQTAVQVRVRTSDALNPELGTRTTPRDMCRLLRAIWSDQAGPPAVCRRVRELMGQQLAKNRLAAGFAPPIRVSAKSGSLIGLVRNEIGVIAYPDGSWYAAAVFIQVGMRSRGAAAIDAAIGQAAATSIGLLRRLPT
jgi:beta-lactamase class A